MKRYEKYKDSGIEWIGEIPEHWGVKKVKYIAKNLDGKRIPLNSSERAFISGDYPYYGANGIVDYINDFIFDGEHVLIGEDGAPFFINNRDVAFFVSGKFWVNNHAHILQIINGNNPKIITHQLNCVEYREYISGSTRDKLTQDKLSAIKLISIPKLEQTTIASYLDLKTAEIDDLIAKKEQLLALYEEEKTAIINQAVTKGINHDVKMKDSGIDWLGEIPEHWEVKKLKYVISKAGSGVTPKGGANVYQLSGIPLLRSQNIQFDGLKLDDVAYISEDIHNDMSNSKVQNGDVLLNITGASIGRCHFITNNLDEANVNQHVCIIRPKSEISTKLLFYILRSNIGQEQINQEQTGSGREGLNFESLKNFIALSFDMDEQTAIVTHIEKETARIDAKIEKTNKLIALQKEYRTALISEVVTGKIKITNENES